MDVPHAEILLVQELTERLRALHDDHLLQRQREKQNLRIKYPGLQGDPTIEDHGISDFISGGLFRVLGRLESYDPLKALATLGPVLDPAAKTVEPLSDQVVTIDLTSDDDEENSKDIGVHKSVPAAEATLSPPRLLVDTQLLGNEWKLQIKSTYEFTGEARWEATQHQQQRPSWRLQARMVRNMDGVDLYTYIHSVRLMRQFVGSNI